MAYRNGGNAIDAALAAAASLTVTLPDNCQLGGDLIALVRDPSGQMTAVNSSGPAAKGTPVDELRQEHGNSMPLVGPQTVTVPGLIAGWEALFNHGASLAWADLFSAAITQAEDGIPVGRSVATALPENEERLLGDPGMSELFFPRGKPLGIDDHLRQPRLAQTLGQIAEHGAGSFYRGEL